MPTKRALGTRVGDDPWRVEAEQLFVGKRRPSAQTRFGGHVDDASRHEHVMKAGSRGPTVEPIAVNPNVDAASPVLIPEACRDRSELPNEVVRQLPPAFGRAEHAG